MEPVPRPSIHRTDAVDQLGGRREVLGRLLDRRGQAGSAPGLPHVPGYEVFCVLGRGGMGVVYRARHLRLDRLAAIKMVLGGRYHDPAALARFQVEAEAVAAVDHPHVVGVYEFGTHDALPYFALEYVGSGSLAERLARDGRFAPRAAAERVGKVAAGMSAAHAKGIVHRDLKPANVLLTPAGEPKAADFGLARVGPSDLTATGAVMGTPSYMSPEQAAGRSKEVGTPADAYALGAVLYELLTGRPPFRGDTSVATLHQVLTRDPDRPRGTRKAAPDVDTLWGRGAGLRGMLTGSARRSESGNRRGEVTALSWSAVGTAPGPGRCRP